MLQENKKYSITSFNLKIIYQKYKKNRELWWFDTS